MHDLDCTVEATPLRDLIQIPGGKTPRVQQIHILDQIDEAVRAGKKYIILQAPTGVGKTAVAHANLSGAWDGYACTSTKQLQSQYLGHRDLMRLTERRTIERIEKRDTSLSPLGKVPQIGLKPFCTYYSLNEVLKNGKNTP